MQPLGDILGRADRLILPGLGPAVALEDRGMDAPGLVARIADDDGAEPGRPLDLGRVPSDGLAMLDQDRLLAADGLDPAADVVRVGIARHELERDLLAPTADEQRQALLDRRRVVPHATSPSSAGRPPSGARRGASRA